MNDISVTDRSLTEPEIEEIRQRCREVMEQNNYNQSTVSKLSGVAYSTVAAWLAGTYTGNNSKVTAKMQTWLDSLAEQNEVRLTVPDMPGYLATPSAVGFATTLQLSQIMSDIGVIVGGAGIGKTEAAKEYANRNPNVWLVTMRPTSSSKLRSLRKIAKVLRLDTGGSDDALTDQIAERITGTGGLLIIDEAQHLVAEALDEIRSIYDATDQTCGVALLGNESFYARIEGGRTENFSQIHSRFGDRIIQPKPYKGDVDMLLEAWGVTDPNEIKFLRMVARKPGALRVMSKTLRLAGILASGGGEARSIDHIDAAYKRLSASSSGGSHA